MRFPQIYWFAAVTLVQAGVGLTAVQAKSDSGTVIFGTNGSCEQLVVKGSSESCTSGVMYMAFPNGRRMYLVGIGKNKTIGFVGESSSQPQSGVNHLYLQRVRVESHNSAFVTNVAGECVLQTLVPSSKWNRLDCDAKDEDGVSFSLHFRADGKSTSPSSSENPARDHVPSAIVMAVSKDFKETLRSGGMERVNQKVQACYDGAPSSRIDLLRMCMLYDMASYDFAQNMTLMFRARGLPDPNSGFPFRSRDAFDARMQIYSGLAFDGSMQTVFQYFGNSPQRIVTDRTK